MGIGNGWGSKFYRVIHLVAGAHLGTAIEFLGQVICVIGVQDDRARRWFLGYPVSIDVQPPEDGVITSSCRDRGRYACEPEILDRFRKGRKVDVAHGGIELQSLNGVPVASIEDELPQSRVEESRCSVGASADGSVRSELQNTITGLQHRLLVTPGTMTIAAQIVTIQEIDLPSLSCLHE